MTIYSNGKSLKLGSNNSSSSLDVYSTDEQIVGTWVNGKPIYRKVYYATTPGSTTVESQVLFSVADLHIDEAVTVRGILAEDGRGSYVSAPYYHNNEFRVYLLLCGESSVWAPNTMRCIAGSSVTSKPIKIILEYTKTTDSATKTINVMANSSISYDISQSAAITSSPAELI